MVIFLRVNREPAPESLEDPFAMQKAYLSSLATMWHDENITIIIIIADRPSREMAATLTRFVLCFMRIQTLTSFQTCEERKIFR